MKNQKLLVLLTVAVVLGGVVAFGAFSPEDSGGAIRRALFRAPAVSAPGASTVPSANGGSSQLTPALTVQSHTAGNNGNFVSDVRLDFMDESCNESFYSHLGVWKFTSNMPLTAVRGAKFQTGFGGMMTDYKVKVGTEPDSDNIASYEVSAAPNNFNAYMPNNETFALPAGVSYVTLLGKYKASTNLNRAVTGEVALFDRGILGGSFVQPLVGNLVPLTSSHVENNQSNFTAGFTEFGPYDDMTCNKFE